MEQPTILEVRNLKKYFPIQTDLFGRPTVFLKAVDDVSFSMTQGETLGLVGESGCGKSTTGKTIIRLYQPTAGEIRFNGQLIDNPAAEKELRRNMQMIFQDPYASLNPRMTVAKIIGEPLDIHLSRTSRSKMERIDELLDMVGLTPAHKNHFPHEFSGGQRQRISIARALALNPQFIICDEPISALDVSIQAQIINLLQHLQEKLRLTYLFIAHDLAMVKHISNRVAVMYHGKIVELAASEELYGRPQHPYTQALLAAIPIPRPRPGPALKTKRQPLQPTENQPYPVNSSSGCPFNSRCRQALAICAEHNPPLNDLGAGHLSACHLPPKS